MAFYLYLRWRRADALTVAQVTTLVVLYVLAVLTKQVFVMLPIVLFWYEIGVRNISLRAVTSRFVPSWGTAIAAAATALVGYELLVLYAMPLSATAKISPQVFMLSQIANAPVIASFYLLPYQTALIHDLYLYRDLAHVEVWLGLALIATIVVVAYRWRAHPVGWLLGALLICLIPTNSFLAKNEIVREWRLYPSLVFYALLAAEVVSRTAVRLQSRLPYLVVSIYLATLAHSDVLQNRVYQTSIGAWQQVLARYPYSADSMNNLGIHYYRRRELEKAAEYFQMAVDAAPETSLYRRNLAEAYWALGRRETAMEHSAAAKEIIARHGARGMTLHYR